MDSCPYVRVRGVRFDAAAFDDRLPASLKGQDGT